MNEFNIGDVVFSIPKIYWKIFGKHFNAGYGKFTYDIILVLNNSTSYYQPIGMVYQREFLSGWHKIKSKDYQHPRTNLFK
jgi:hypothetical protein